MKDKINNLSNEKIITDSDFLSALLSGQPFIVSAAIDCEDYKLSQFAFNEVMNCGNKDLLGAIFRRKDVTKYIDEQVTDSIIDGLMGEEVLPQYLRMIKKPLECDQINRLKAGELSEPILFGLLQRSEVMIEDDFINLCIRHKSFVLRQLLAKRTWARQPTEEETKLGISDNRPAVRLEWWKREDIKLKQEYFDLEFLGNGQLRLALAPSDLVFVKDLYNKWQSDQLKQSVNLKTERKAKYL